MPRLCKAPHSRGNSKLFGSKSEKRLDLDDEAQLNLLAGLGVEKPPSRDDVPTETVSYERRAKVRDAAIAQSGLRFGPEVPVQTIEMTDPALRRFRKAEREVIGEKVSYRLAQQPGSYVVLKYIRKVVKRRDTETILTAAAPAKSFMGKATSPPPDVSRIAPSSQKSANRIIRSNHLGISRDKAGNNMPEQRWAPSSPLPRPRSLILSCCRRGCRRSLADVSNRCCSTRPPTRFGRANSSSNESNPAPLGRSSMQIRPLTDHGCVSPSAGLIPIPSDHLTPKAGWQCFAPPFGLVSLRP